MYMQRLFNTPVYTQLLLLPKEIFAYEKGDRTHFNLPFQNTWLQLEPSLGNPHTKPHIFTASSQIHYSGAYSSMKYPKLSDPMRRAAFLSRTEYSLNNTCLSPHSLQGKYVKTEIGKLLDAL